MMIFWPRSCAVRGRGAEPVSAPIRMSDAADRVVVGRALVPAQGLHSQPRPPQVNPVHGRRRLGECPGRAVGWGTKNTLARILGIVENWN
jgi:hypothetical protein